MVKNFLLMNVACKLNPKFTMRTSLTQILKIIHSQEILINKLITKSILNHKLAVRVISIISITMISFPDLHSQRWSEKIAGTVMTIWKYSPDIVPGQQATWRYHQDVTLKSIEGLWLRTGEKNQNQNPTTIVVSADGKGNFRSIQAAINSLPDSSSQPRIIQVRNGIYNEKIYLEKHNVVIKGEDRERTIITQAIARDEWRCKHNDDWGVATFNLDANDITLENLTIINSFGRDNKIERLIPCSIDTTGKPKVITKASHQMALRTMNATRLKAINCRFTAYGGDTVSPWNVDGGLFYFKNCIMEGGVDFYCPRGWAYAENCQFIVQSGTAAIWHDGSRHQDSKTVLKDCSFSGYDGFRLGRYHRDAQFYLVN
ncbi:MAG: hypothetical protein EOO04_24370, partial [Chitinophagaceae bacterium]